MALLLPPLSFVSPSLSSSSIPSRLSLANVHSPYSMSMRKNFILQAASFNGIRIPAPLIVYGRRAVDVWASSDTNGIDANGTDIPKERPAEDVSVENLPLESKLQMKLEQKLRMSLAKKIRLRRKRLVRKRQMRKKGRWPPSKMKKNKNV